MPSELAEKRAAICAGCPSNEQGDLLSFFTKPLSEAIRRAYNLRAEYKLRTSQDDKLGVCGICSCPLKLMLHVPLEMKLKHLPDDVRAGLPPHCWVIKESSGKTD